MSPDETRRLLVLEPGDCAVDRSHREQVLSSGNIRRISLSTLAILFVCSRKVCYPLFIESWGAIMRINLGLLASAALLSSVFGQFAAAADAGLPPRPVPAPVPNWAGFYVSGSAGATWLGASTFSQSATRGTQTSQQFQSGFFDPATNTVNNQFFLTSDSTTQNVQNSSSDTTGRKQEQSLPLQWATILCLPTPG